ncbi:MAG: VanW family protein [Eggerthellaceae bacterium]|nr:VanW family protein [Eggerthellaceae bacterium]
MAETKQSKPAPTRRSVSDSARASKPKSTASSTKQGAAAAKQTKQTGTARQGRTAATKASSRATGTRTATTTSGVKAALQKGTNAVQGAVGAVAQKTAPYRVSAGGKKQSNVVTIIIASVAVIAIVLLLDFFLHVGRIHNNIYIGDVNVGGMKRSEAVLAVDTYYYTYLSEEAATAYVSPEVRSQKQADQLYYMITVNETYLENHPDILIRKIPASELEGAVASADLVDEAFSYGRGLKGFFTRLSLLFKPYVITPYAVYGETALQKLADEFNAAAGLAMTNCNIVLENGYARVVAGNDGYTVDIDMLVDPLNKAYFSDNPEDKSFVMYSSFTPMGLDLEMSKAEAEMLNNALGDGVVYSYNGMAWSASPITVMSWITINRVQAEDGTWSYEYVLNDSAIYSWLLKWILADEKDSIPVKMEVAKSGKVTVYPDVSGRIPALSEAVSSLYVALFGDEKHKPDSGATAVDGNPVFVEVKSMSVDSSMSIEDAIAKGVVSPIATFSTTYITGSATDNRTANVLLAASILNGTIVKAGEEFSFNDIIGATTEEKGYKVASVIDTNGNYVDGYGGGVCQVSTTLFNAVYQAGYPITKRFAHLLYSANYPDGLDATVDYPTADFKWVNDTDSDIYIAFSDDGRSITCTLYGADPHYVVWSYTYPWEHLYDYSTIYYYDSTKNAGYDEVKSVGVPARKITVWRKVLDPDGKTVRIDEYFTSTYRALDEVRTVGSLRAQQLRDQGYEVRGF